MNQLSGVGVLGRDRRKSSHVCVDEHLHSREAQEEAWEADDVVDRLVTVWPNEMMRAGFELTINSDAADTSTTEADPTDPGKSTRADAFPAAGAGGPPAPEPTPAKPPGVIEPKDQEERKQAHALTARWEELAGPEKYQTALEYQRAYGGGAIYVGAQDGLAPHQPLNLKNIKSIDWLSVFSAHELYVVRWYSDPTSPKYGEPEIYRFLDEYHVELSADSSTMAPAKPVVKPVIEVHESRLVVFPGVVVSKRQRARRRGWGNSILVRALSVIADYQMSYGSAAALLSDFAQAVFKIKGLAEIVASNEDDAIRKRLDLIEMSRSVIRATVIDQDEDFERKQTPINGLPDLLDRMGERLAVVADMPLTLLLGRSPGGLNATGESDMRSFYDRVDAKRVRDLKPRLLCLFKLFMLAKDGPTAGVEPEDYDIEFGPLYQLTDLEVATMHFTQAQADEKYVGMSATTPEEIAASRFGGRKYSLETTIDLEGRKKLAADYETQLADHQENKAASADQAAKDGDHAKKLATMETQAKLIAAKRKPPAR